MNTFEIIINFIILKFIRIALCGCCECKEISLKKGKSGRCGSAVLILLHEQLPYATCTIALVVTGHGT